MAGSNIETDTTRPARPVKVGHLVMGVIFLGIVVIWALGTNGTIDWGASGYLAPAILVAAGVLGLAASVLPRRRRTAVPSGHPTYRTDVTDREVTDDTTRLAADAGDDPTIRIEDEK